MTIRIEITGESASQIAQELVTMACLLAPRLKDSLAASTASGPSPDAPAAEPVDEPKKPRGRKAKGEVIEHDPKEGQADVHTEGSAGGDGGGNAPADDAEVSGAEGDARTGEVRSDDDAAAEQSAEEPAAADTAASAEAEPACMTRDELRKYLINQYLNVVFEDMEDRKKDYKTLLDEFGIEAIADIPEEKINAFKAAIDARIAAAVGAK